MSLTHIRGRAFCFPGVGLFLALSALLGASSKADDPVTATRIALKKAMANAANQPRAPMIAREIYLRRQEIGGVRLSPDGRHLSFHRRSEQGVDVILQDLSSNIQTRIVAIPPVPNTPTIK